MISENRHLSHGLIWAYLRVPSVLFSQTQPYALQRINDRSNSVIFSLSRRIQTPIAARIRTPLKYFFKDNDVFNFKKVSLSAIVKKRGFQGKVSWKKPILISSVGLMLIVAFWRLRDVMKANHSKEGVLTATFEGLWQYIYFFHKIPGDALSEDKSNNFSPLHLEQSSERDAPSPPHQCLFTPSSELKPMIDETTGQPSELSAELKVSDNNLEIEEVKLIPIAESKAGEWNWKKFVAQLC